MAGSRQGTDVYTEGRQAGLLSAEGLHHSVGPPPNCLNKGLPVRTWRLHGLYAVIRGPYQDKSDRVADATTAAYSCSLHGKSRMRL